ncbi:prephenate dehydrogenase [Candidatus Methylacidithermus pantelleriae]|uniref:Prephenate dehydrogenase n=1 Tax=Candidatus Methylacidithermus pantelleriae TaxID=2744239 RepID=A0A8J2BQZ8_9BACT|nr:prephenate dehydrogenase/arogenate dehydrogenase family protein [Candidatus Methylacidithermus pantelleriae]CAF0691977.1 Prephenate dehydrogenase [Candidatus Methylacidithermus pantelleriae]
MCHTPESDFWPVSRVAVIGMGLIGGSIAWAIRDRLLAKDLVVYDANPLVRNQVESSALGCVVSASAEEAVRGAQLILLAVPPGAIEPVLREIRPALDPKALVMDTASVKVPVVQLLQEILAGKAHWAASHPMAGSEKSGFEAAHGRLFDGAVAIVCPEPGLPREFRRLVTLFWEALGCRVFFLGAEVHDRWVAQVSHFPHLLAAALVRWVDREALAIAGPGFRDSTRIAASCPALWKEILWWNRKSLVEALDTFLEELTLVRQALESSECDQLERLLTEASGIRQALETGRWPRTGKEH